MRALTHFFLALVLLAAGGCLHDDSDGNWGTTDGTGNGTGGDNGGGGTLALTAADRAGITPCPLQEILTDPAKLAELKAALQSGTLIYLDVPYDESDPDIFKKKCGLEGYWDPTQNTDGVSLADLRLDPATDPNIADLILFGNAGICTAGFTKGSFGIGEGFPVAGTYRKEIKAALDGKTYHLRFRAHVSGSSAGKTFAEESITLPDGVRGLVYTVNGTQTAHDDVFAAVVDGLAASTDAAPSAVVEVRKSAEGAVIFTATIEIICVSSSLADS